MNMQRIDELEGEIRELNIAVLGAEGWAAGYATQPQYFKQLLENETAMDKAFRDYFRRLAVRIGTYIDWARYHRDVVAVNASEVKTIEAYDVNVLFDDQQFSNDQQTEIEQLIKEIYIDGVAIGFAAQRAAVGITTPFAQTVESPIYTAIQEAADEHVKQLAQYLDETTAKNVVSVIQESIAAGESQIDAAKRLAKYIDNPDRAGLIARTESVRAWSIGQNTFALRNGATQKQWEALPGADSGSNQTPCLDNDGAIVDISDSFPSGDDMTPAHPNCRCKVNYIYPDNAVVEDV